MKTRFFLVLTALLLLVSCGIPSFAYLEPPTVESTTESDPVLRFHHNTINDTDYIYGYDLFYKFYATSAELTTDAALIESVTTHATLMEGASRIFPLYRRDGSNVKVTDSPLIQTDAFDEATATLFHLAYTVNPLILTNFSAGPSTTNIYRISSNGTETDANLPFSFSSESLDPSWEDVPDGFDDNPVNAEIYVGFYACAFGYDEFTKIYSKTILLATKKIVKS
jgi:hypothetical protein